MAWIRDRSQVLGPIGKQLGCRYCDTEKGQRLLPHVSDQELVRVRVGEIRFNDPSGPNRLEADLQIASNAAIGLQGWLDGERGKWIKENSRDLAFAMDYYLVLDEWVMAIYAWFEPEAESFFALKWANLPHEDQWVSAQF